ncbi:MAG: hypothetical protein H5T69_05250 [Chloroflexi bacterium]|nr:hypothetical protein [Chloroflexota bacterium]
MTAKARGLVFLGTFCIVLLLGAAIFLLLRSLFGTANVGREALAKRPEAADEVEALIAIVLDESLEPQERTRAVWALGQIRDPRALPVLEALYTGEPCDHERAICQYELGKSILKIRGKFRGGWQVPHEHRPMPLR